MTLAPRPELSEATKRALLETLKTQHKKLTGDAPPVLECSMLKHGDSYCFVNSLFADPKAFASTQVCLKELSPVKFRSFVQIKRDVDGRAMQSITVRGPEFKCVAHSDRPSQWKQMLLFHSSVVLFHVYCKLVYGHASKVVPLALPPVPSAGSFVRVKYHEPGGISLLPLSPSSPPPSSPGQCYICWNTAACDVLFPCGVSSHACCQQCALKLYERWSSTEVNGEATVRCPTCSCATGPLRLTSGGIFVLPSKRYTLRKLKKPSYCRTRVIR